jgi:hypothetical protein
MTVQHQSLRPASQRIAELSQQFCDSLQANRHVAQEVSNTAVIELGALSLSVRNVQDQLQLTSSAISSLNPLVNANGKYVKGTREITADTPPGNKLSLRDACSRVVHRRDGDAAMVNPTPSSPQDHSLIFAGDWFTAVFTVAELLDAVTKLEDELIRRGLGG